MLGRTIELAGRIGGHSNIMALLHNPRAIIARKALTESIDQLAAGESDPGRPELRAAVLQRLKTAVAEGEAELMRRLGAGETGIAYGLARTYLADQLLRVLYEFTLRYVVRLANPSAAERLALVATGGYGRRELAPYSDIDLLFLLPYKITPSGEQVVETILYFLWDLGFKVGHATRSVEECIRQAKADWTIRTNLLEARFIWGDEALFEDLQRRYATEVHGADPIGFVEAKLAERDERHRRMGDSRYVLEPNIKDGKGGLRDLQTLYWIAKYLYRIDDVASLPDQGVLTPAEVSGFEKARLFLLTLRCHLHAVAGRAEDRLTFDLQPQVGRRMGYTDHAGSRGVERVMKHYFLIAKEVGDLTRIFCAALEAAQRRKPKFRGGFAWRRRMLEGFVVEGGRLNVSDPGIFAAQPVQILKLFRLAQREKLDIHPAALQLVTRHLKLVRGLTADRDANRLFLEMLTAREDPETTLRRLNEAGVFGRFIPDFGRVVAQMQYDMYHSFTVDEHTIRAIGMLNRIESGALRDELPVASAVVHKVLSRRVLYLAVLLHDIAKGRGGDHSELGAEIALKLCPRLGLEPDEIETVAWLVRYHLLMSNTAFKRDIDDASTIETFSAAVQSIERLRLLLVLTAADIRAVGPKTWNGWKATLLRELYYRTEEHLSGGLITEGREARVKAAQDALRLLIPDWTDDVFAEHAARAPASYWLGFDPETQARHARLVREAEATKAPLLIESRVLPARAVTEVTIVAADHPGLFARLAGGLALSGADIVDARIFTLTNGLALDTFTIQTAEGGPFDRPDRLAKLAANLERVLAGGVRPEQELRRLPQRLPSRTQAMAVVPRVLIDNKASATHTVVEVTGRDRPGFLYQVTSALTAQNLQISTAKISTFGVRAVDVFYVKDQFGLKIDKEARLAQIREALLAAVSETTETARAVG
ncbi:MAG: [protein-PII] uridylyltransferase [Rhodospirillales bacterium]|nr:[protein-PII] uridylyltransferase [Rhodospirillales bacterium]